MNVSNKRFLSLAIVGFLLVIFFGVTGANANAVIPKFSGDLLNLLAVLCALITVWQIVSNAINQMQTELAKRDQLHDEHISKLWVKVEANTTSINHHLLSYGHNGTIEEMVRIKDKLSQVEAVCAVSFQLGSIILRIEDLEKDAIKK